MSADLDGLDCLNFDGIPEYPNELMEFSSIFDDYLVRASVVFNNQPETYELID